MARKWNLASQVRSALRRVWMYSPERKAATDAARVAYGWYQCAQCGVEVGAKDKAVDHEVPCGHLAHDLSNLSEWAIRLMFGPLQVLCPPCHKTKTAAERASRKKAK